MARMIMTAEAHAGSAAYYSVGQAMDGNQDPLTIVVSVQRTTGAGRAGLTAANFFVSAMTVGAGGGGVTWTLIQVGGPVGVYSLRVVPIPAAVWKAGGQTLCKARIE